MKKPKNVIILLLDSLNRHMLGAYGGKEFSTPNIDRLAERSLKFTNHYTGSLPCMPARHDILCGTWDFLWRPWGSVEIWEDAITYPLRRAGVVTQLISDHPHLFESGGENYHADFAGWDYQRGHEGDPWKTRPDPSWAGAPRFGRGHMPYDNSRGWFRGEEDFPGPRTMTATARWLSDNAGHHDRFMLFVDEFDPHEPFDTPEPYASMYDSEWDGTHLIWPPYMRGAISSGTITERQGRQIRAQYGAKLTMIDHWLGRVLDQIDQKNLWEDTAVILCTDHGHYLGEKDIWGKPGVPIYDTLGRIPLLIAWPGQPARDIDALTTSVDLFATLTDIFGVNVRQPTHGNSLLPLIADEAKSIRPWALMGVWGREVHITDGRWKYARAPHDRNEPLAMMSNRWSTMPTHVLSKEQELPLPDDTAVLSRMPGSNVPVIKQVWDVSNKVPFWAWAKFNGNLLFDTHSDPSEDDNRIGGPDEKRMSDLLRDALTQVQAPDEQLTRLGL